MPIEDFARERKSLHALTVDFVRVVPDDKWEFAPNLSQAAVRPPAPNRPGAGFAPVCKQLRHVACVRRAYNAGLVNGSVDSTRKRDHYRGPVSRDVLLSALEEKEQ